MVSNNLAPVVDVTNVDIISNMCLLYRLSSDYEKQEIKTGHGLAVPTWDQKS